MEDYSVRLLSQPYVTTHVEIEAVVYLVHPTMLTYCARASEYAATSASLKVPYGKAIKLSRFIFAPLLDRRNFRVCNSLV